MGLSTSVYVGPYLICKMKNTVRVETKFVCSQIEKHSIRLHTGEYAKYCPACGSEVIEKPFAYDDFSSYSDIYYEPETPEQHDLAARFYYIPSEWVGFDDKQCEIIVTVQGVTIDADSEGVHNISFDALLESISPKDIEQLKSIVGYESVVVRYGVLVQLA